MGEKKAKVKKKDQENHYISSYNSTRKKNISSYDALGNAVTTQFLYRIHCC